MTGDAAVFAIGRVPGDGGGDGPARAGRNPFPGTAVVTLPAAAGGPAAGVDVYAGRRARVGRWLDPATGRAVYVVGRATHPTLAGDALLKWVGDVAGGDADHAALREAV
ncbi:MAG TPA: hypothetical protein VF796_26975, partial [Humisphaera sp.]